MAKNRPRVRLRKPDDIRRLTQRVINQLLSEGDMTTEKARVISTLGNTALKSMEQGDMEERMAAVEKKIDEVENANRKGVY